MKAYPFHAEVYRRDTQVSVDKADRICDVLHAEHGWTKETVLAAADALLRRDEELLKKHRDLIDPQTEKAKELVQVLSRTIDAVYVGRELERGLANSHGFVFEGGVVDLLLETSAPAPEHLPFTQCFLDAAFRVPETKWRVVGILASEARKSDEPEILFPEAPALDFARHFLSDTPDDILCVALVTDETGKPWMFPTLVKKTGTPPDEMLVGTYGGKMVDMMGRRDFNRVQRCINDFVKAWTAMVTDPEVIVVESHKSPNARKKLERELKGKVPASIHAIRITGTLRRYVQQVRAFAAGEERAGRRAHYVRGHFRTLRAERYKEKRGSTLWIPPHVRGMGPVVRNEYEVVGEPEGA